METKGKKYRIIGWTLFLLSVGLVAGTFWALGKTGFQSIYLGDAENDTHNWTYEIRTGSGEVKQIALEYENGYAELPSEASYDAVKKSRKMTETLPGAELELDYMQCSIEVFLDETLLYSDFHEQTQRDADGFRIGYTLQVDDEARSICIGLPEDYTGRELTMYLYYPEAAEVCYDVNPLVKNYDTEIAPILAGNVWSMFYLILLGCLAAGMALLILISGMHQRIRADLILLFFTYLIVFGIAAYQSDMGYYSGLQAWMNQHLFRHLPVSVDMIRLIVLLISALLLLLLEIYHIHRGEKRTQKGQTLVFGLVAFLLTARQNSTELANGIVSYLPSVFRSFASGNSAALIRLCSSVMIYMITMSVIVQFVQWSLQERKKQAVMLERSRYARENYELIMQVDEDSRRRRHELRHHMETIHELLVAQETQKAGAYIESVLQEERQMAERTYSSNVTVNSIIGFRLSQARKNGIQVTCAVHVPTVLAVDDVDLSILLSNMLENSLEACMRMKHRENAYIHLEIRKTKSFLFVECVNSVEHTEKAEILKTGQKTIKSDRADHGFGLEAMRRVAEKYEGILQIEQEQGRFTIRTNLSLSE